MPQINIDHLVVSSPLSEKNYKFEGISSYLQNSVRSKGPFSFYKNLYCLTTFFKNTVQHNV